jgi:hypothetical protein
MQNILIPSLDWKWKKIITEITEITRIINLTIKSKDVFIFSKFSQYNAKSLLNDKIIL